MKAKEFIVFFLINLIVFFALTRSAIFAPFTIINDHEIISLAKPSLVTAFKEDERNYNSLIGISKFWIVKVGRFLPLHITMKFVQARLFHLHPFFYHFTIFLTGVLTTVLFFTLLRLIGVSILVASVISFTFQAGAYCEIWYVLSEGETWGCFFLIFALVVFAYSIIKKNPKFSIYGLSLFLLACLSKESFLFTAPFIALFFILFYAYKSNLDFLPSIKQTSAVWITLLAIMVASLSLIMLTIFLSHVFFSYGRPTSYIENGLSNLINMLKPCLFLFPVIILCFKRFRTGIDRYMLAAVIITAGWVIAQLIAHKDFSMRNSRYFIPGVIAPFVLLAFSIEYFNKPRWKRYFVAIIGIYSIMLGYRWYTVARDTSYYGQYAVTYNKMLDFVVGKHIQSIGVCGAPYASWDFIASTVLQLKIRNQDVPLFFIDDEMDIAPASLELNNALKVAIRTKFETLPLKDVALKKSNWIIINSDPRKFYQFLTPISVYSFEGRFTRFNLMKLRFEESTRPLFYLAKT